MTGKIYLYPLWIRLWHVANAVLIILLILSGVSLQYSGADFPLIGFQQAVSLHNVSGIILTISYVVFFIGNILHKNGMYYKLQKDGLKSLFKQFNYYLIGVFKGQKAPYEINEYRKFNPLQKLAYITIMYVCLPFMIITGWALLFPEVIVTQMAGVSGTFLTAFFHSVVAFVISIFLLIHIYFSTFGLKINSNFKSIINGYHESK